MSKRIGIRCQSCVSHDTVTLIAGNTSEENIAVRTKAHAADFGVRKRASLVWGPNASHVPLMPNPKSAMEMMK